MRKAPPKFLTPRRAQHTSSASDGCPPAPNRMTSWRSRARRAAAPSARPSHASSRWSQRSARRTTSSTSCRRCAAALAQPRRAATASIPRRECTRSTAHRPTPAPAAARRATDPGAIAAAGGGTDSDQARVGGRGGRAAHCRRKPAAGDARQERQRRVGAQALLGRPRLGLPGRTCSSLW